MKLKLVVIDLELSTRAKRIAAGVLVPVLVLAGGAIAYANVPHTWSNGDTLEAADLNGNFTSLDQRVTALEANTPTYLTTASNVTGTAAFETDFVYQGMSLVLTPGTWLVQGFGSVMTTVNPDTVQIALWDDTNGVEIPNSRSPDVTTGALGTGCTYEQNTCGAVATMTSSVISVTANTTIRVKVFRNGASQVWIGPALSLALPTGNRLTAVKLDLLLAALS